jgi:uncharacterized phage-associated protein
VIKLYSIKDIAKYILSQEDMSHKKLQKTCFYVYVWSLVYYSGQKLIDTSFQAWVHGPVSFELYNEYRKNESQLIKGNNNIKIDLSFEIKMIADNVIKKYKNFDGNLMEFKTHNESPWKFAREGLSKYQPSNEEISDNNIYNYYKKQDERLEILGV